MTHHEIECPPDRDDGFAEFDATARGEIGLALDAVCAELGLDGSRDTSRAKIASGIATTWRDGRRHPLNLVHAGLDAVCA